MEMSPQKTDWRLVGLGAAALGLGIVFYLLYRPPAQTYFIPEALSLYSAKASTFGGLGNHLPTFLHVFAFSLITSGMLGCTRQGALLACLFWLFVNAFFEIGQHPAVAEIIIPVIPGWFDGIPILENTASYFRQGRFDAYDLLSIVLGGIGAYLLIIYMLSKVSTKQHEP
jgi:hypothetical protein